MSEETLDMLAELRALVSERSDLMVQLDASMELCPACDGLSPGISMDGETVMHCLLCHDTGQVMPDQAKVWEERIRSLKKGDNA